MDIYNAIENYNRHRKTDKIFFSWIATKLGISKQALYNLTLHGGKKGLLKYKDKLEEILPKELFDNIDFPIKKHTVKKPRIAQREPFQAHEKALLKEYYWVVGKNLYEKIMANEGVTVWMHDKIMGKIEEAKQWIEEVQKNNSSDEYTHKLVIELDTDKEGLIKKVDDMELEEETKEEIRGKINEFYK